MKKICAQSHKTFQKGVALPITIVCVAMLSPACSSPPAATPAAAPAVVERHTPPSPTPAREAAPREIVSIAGQNYVVPPPWRGNKLSAPPLPLSSFRLIPISYTHNRTKLHIRKEAYEPLVALLRQAEADGISLKVESAYRSKRYQKQIFTRMLAAGRTFADIVRYVAPPGYSQHMLGLSVDFFPSNWRFASTDQYAWLQKHAHRFGFTESYPEFNRKKMPWEAWHWGYHLNIGGDQPDTHLNIKTKD